MAAMQFYELVNTLSSTTNMHGCGLLFLCNVLSRNIQLSLELVSLSSHNVTFASDLLKHLNFNIKPALVRNICP